MSLAWLVNEDGCSFIRHVYFTSDGTSKPVGLWHKYTHTCRLVALIYDVPPFGAFRNLQSYSFNFRRGLNWISLMEAVLRPQRCCRYHSRRGCSTPPPALKSLLAISRAASATGTPFFSVFLLVSFRYSKNCGELRYRVCRWLFCPPLPRLM